MYRIRQKNSKELNYEETLESEDLVVSEEELDAPFEISSDSSVCDDWDFKVKREGKIFDNVNVKREMGTKVIEKYLGYRKEGRKSNPNTSGGRKVYFDTERRIRDAGKAKTNVMKLTRENLIRHEIETRNSSAGTSESNLCRAFIQQTNPKDNWFPRKIQYAPKIFNIQPKASSFSVPTRFLAPNLRN